MYLRRLLVLAICVVAANSVLAQDDDFCNAIVTIAHDGPGKFKNIKGKPTKSGGSALAWECGIKVPGTISSRFVASNGLFYEGAVFQSRNRADVRPAYEKYRAMLSDCLLAKGYKFSLQDNFYPGMSDFKKLVFMPEVKDDAMLETVPAHITMETTYSKDIQKYTIVIYIFEH